jgi:hypothetical protein
LNLLIILLAAAPMADVTLVMSDKFLRMPKDTGSIRMIYRNTSELTLKNAKVTVRSDTPVDIRIRPERIHRCQPADRCTFAIEARRTPETPSTRFSVIVTLQADHRPDIHAAKLFVDTTPGAGRRESGWMEAGSIKVGRGSKTGRVLVLTLLCALPVAALLILGIYLKKKARKETA